MLPLVDNASSGGGGVGVGSGNSSGADSASSLTSATYYAFPLHEVVIIAVVLGAISLATILGNILVLVAFLVDAAIRIPSNYFIASLAITDLLIGLFSMNFFSVYLLLGYWPMSRYLCDAWLFVDYTACLTSQYTVLFITIDRFCSVRIPAKYRSWQRGRNTLIIVAVSWCVPAVIFVVLILVWPWWLKAAQEQARQSIECYAEFTTNGVFNLVFTVFYYWLTLAVMVVLYTGIYRVARRLHKRARAQHRRTALMTMAGHTITNIGVSVNWMNTNNSPCDDMDDLDNGDCSSLPSPPPPLQPTTTAVPASSASSPPKVSEPFRLGMPAKPASSSSTTAIMTTSRDDFLPGARRDLSGPAEDVLAIPFIDDAINTTPTSGSRRGSQRSNTDNSNHLMAAAEEQVSLLQLLPESPAHTYRYRTDVSPRDTGSTLRIQYISKPSSTSSIDEAMGRRAVVKQDSTGEGILQKRRRNKDNHHHKEKLKNPLAKITQRLASTRRSDKQEESSTRSENRARKALRTISIILGAFVLCWTPYHILVLVKGFCDVPGANYSCVNVHLYNFSYWLCYMNSPINPFCYALANAQFKRVFARLLKGDWRIR